MNIKYRSEIDGLRAIAVGIIIIYHAKINIFNYELFTGGFIGVDVFFVISGYLITRILLAELNQYNQISLTNFYTRRIKRIYPALLIMMSVSFIFAWMYLYPFSLIEFSKSSIASIGMFSNYYFYYEGQDYHAVSSLLKPLLHTWSLSIEEQFYLLYPLFLIFINKYLRKYFIQITILTVIVSFYLAYILNDQEPSLTFYFLHTRLWELLIGAILAYYEISFRNKGYKILKILLPYIGLILILLSAIFFNDDTKHPSTYTLVPLIGTCFIILYSNKNEFLGRLLSTKIFVHFGLISYSLYLWHFPIFAFNRLTMFTKNILIKEIILILILYIIAFLSYKYIEVNFRKKIFSSRNIKIIFTIAVTIFLTINLMVIKNHGFDERFKFLYEINENYNPDNVYLAKERVKFIKKNKTEFNDNKLNVLIVGDSQGEDLFNALYLNKKYFKNFNFLNINTKPNKIIKDSIVKKKLGKADILIFSYRWTADLINTFSNELNEIIKMDKIIYITSRSNEYFMPSDLITILDYEINVKKNKNYFLMKKNYFDNKIIDSESPINKILKEFANREKIIFLNKEDFMCNIQKNECDYIDVNGNKIFFDYGHYTVEGAKYFGEKIFKSNWLKL